tara:strand:+ start:258 stop:1175 length:918 start_codon:yes stop_codon:yes gene_type:complete
MGHIVKKILGDVDKDPEYKNLTIEYNSDGMAHIHLGAIRLDLVKSAYNQLYDGVMSAKRKMSEIHGWVEATKAYDNGHGTKYFEILANGNELFFSPVNPGIRFASLSDEKKKLVQEYSLKDNKIIEISSVSVDAFGNEGVLTKFYSDWVPLVILDVCNFYQKDIFQKHQTLYHNKISNAKFAETLYNQILDEYQNFYDATGVYFSDISANNILISPDFSDFRIIDIESITVLDKDVEVEPHRLLCGHYPPNRSNSVLPGPAGVAATFLRVDAEKNQSWPDNLPADIKRSIDNIESRKIKVKNEKI